MGNEPIGNEIYPSPYVLLQVLRESERGQRGHGVVVGREERERLPGAATDQWKREMDILANENAESPRLHAHTHTHTHTRTHTHKQTHT